MLTKKYVQSRNVYQVTFEIPENQLPKFNITSVHIVADFNNWSIRETAMKHESGRGFVAVIELDPDTDYEFRYLINDDYWYNDWNADKYTPNRLNTADNCVCCVHSAPVAAKPKPAAPKKPAKPAAPAKPDDLKKIDGIGPKISSLLHDGGYPTFAALSKAPIANIKEILAAAGKRYTLAVPDTWPKQAALAAKGDWDALKAYQATLDGGKPKS